MGAVRDPGSEAKIEGTATTAFGKYEVFASLGRGGMADVFLATARGQMGFSKLAVVKRLKPSLAEETGFRRMFLDEARLAARLNHPNIVHTYEVGEQDGVYFIAMEYLEGQSLNAVLKETLRRGTKIEPHVAVRVVADALSGLGYAHELCDYDGRPLRIIHRDISPHNVFVTYDGHTKIVDFGIAKAALSSTETEVGVLKGKVAYMSPEQALGKRLDARADLFAMGIVLWELIAQRRLMTGQSAANTLHKLMNEPIPRLAELVPGVDPALDALVARALERDPEDRFQSASDMRDALESWLSADAHHARQDDVGRWMISLFRSVREDVQRQIQAHMATITSATNTQELRALSAESLDRMEQSGAKLSGHLLSLRGSGSGVVEGGALVSSQPPSMPPPSTSGVHPAPEPAPEPDTSRSILLLLGAIACFVLATTLFVVPALRGRQKNVPPNVGAGAAPSAPPVAVDPRPVDSVAPPSTMESAPIAPSPLPSASASASPSASVSAQPRPSHTGHPPRSLPLPPAKPSSASSPEEPGFLTISAYPWAKVTEGTKAICPVTPCNKISLSPGQHVLTFENGETPGQKQTVTVQIRSGETATKTVGFR
ncbi:MAG TPA: serine/threonine-protein kinase [Labilithrix sp.]|nr:serine/threonine-protein kinase [Labilithrix sp.]